MELLLVDDALLGCCIVVVTRLRLAASEAFIRWCCCWSMLLAPTRPWRKAEELESAVRAPTSMEGRRQLSIMGEGPLVRGG